MSKQIIASSTRVELFRRDTGDDEQMELEVGGREYDIQWLTRAGMEAMIETIDDLHTSLDVIRAELFRMWAEEP